MKNKILSSSAEETYAVGREIGKNLSFNTIVTLEGDLGSGKTTFIRGLVEGAQGAYSRDVCSPTFTLLNIYSGTPEIYHFDLYRLPRLEEFIALGFDEYLQKGICCIEWPEKIHTLLPLNTVSISLSYIDEQKRQIEIHENSF